jgi:hypothetical protein
MSKDILSYSLSIPVPSCSLLVPIALSFCRLVGTSLTQSPYAKEFSLISVVTLSENYFPRVICFAIICLVLENWNWESKDSGSV